MEESTATVYHVWSNWRRG